MVLKAVLALTFSAAATGAANNVPVTNVAHDIVVVILGVVHCVLAMNTMPPVIAAVIRAPTPTPAHTHTPTPVHVVAVISRDWALLEGVSPSGRIILNLHLSQFALPLPTTNTIPSRGRLQSLHTDQHCLVLGLLRGLVSIVLGSSRSHGIGVGLRGTVVPVGTRHNKRHNGARDGRRCLKEQSSHSQNQVPKDKLYNRLEDYPTRPGGDSYKLGETKNQDGSRCTDECGPLDVGLHMLPTLTRTCIHIDSCTGTSTSTSTHSVVLLTCPTHGLLR